mmetsp:Transcript_20848/g.48977  ORF Transcript_20848/g.48977 Transcript_20848/m.48977 type:complete len:209 (-) Transcript_20848:1162-1788(-)
MLHVRRAHPPQRLEPVRPVPRHGGHRVHHPPRPGRIRPYDSPVPKVQAVRPLWRGAALRPPRRGESRPHGGPAQEHPRAVVREEGRVVRPQARGRRRRQGPGQHVHMDRAEQHEAAGRRNGEGRHRRRIHPAESQGGVRRAVEGVSGLHPRVAAADLAGDRPAPSAPGRLSPRPPCPGAGHCKKRRRAEGHTFRADQEEWVRLLLPQP